MPMIIDRLAEDIRAGKTKPADALALMKEGGVLVWPAADEAAETWGQVEDRGANTSGLHHALAAVGAAEMMDEFSAEVARLRDEGQVVDI